MQQMIEKFRSKFAGLSSTSDQSLTQAFDQGLEKSAPLRRRTVAGEQAWIESVDRVYQYAREHHSSFQVANGRLVISDPAVRLEFNIRVDTMNSSRHEFVEAKKELDDSQRDAQRKLGVIPEHIGKGTN